MKRGRGIKGLDDKSKGMEILMTDVFAKISPTDPLSCLLRELKIRLVNEGRCDEGLILTLGTFLKRVLKGLV
jgi:hypothetical protein